MEAVEAFAALLGRPWQLDEAALAVAAGADPHVEPKRWLLALDRLAEGVDSVESLLRKLFVDQGFAGNGERYYDARNSLLHVVLARRTGIPITLAIVLIETGRRSGIALHGVAMPGHFLVGTADGRHIDAFAGGRVLGEEECAALFRRATGAPLPFGPRVLPRATPPAVIARLLENLRQIYRTAQRPGDLEWVLRMRVLLPGTGVEEVLELGAAIGAQGRWLDGARFLDAAQPDWPAHADRLAAAARAQRARLN